MPWGSIWAGGESIPIVPGGVPGNLPVFGAIAGTLVDSGKSIVTTLSGASNNTIPTTLAVANALTGLFDLVGNWDASTNTPTLADGTGILNNAYIVTVAGSQDLGHGVKSYKVGDIVYYGSNNQWNDIPSGNSSVSGIYTPTFTIYSGASNITLTIAIYGGTGSTSGNLITVAMGAVVVTDSSNQLISFAIPNPIGSASLAVLDNFTIVETAKLGDPGNSGSGWINNLSNNSAYVTLNFEASKIDTSYTITAGWQYLVS